MFPRPSIYEQGVWGTMSKLIVHHVVSEDIRAMDGNHRPVIPTLDAINEIVRTKFLLGLEFS